MVKNNPVPDIMMNSIYDITTEYLIRLGIRGLILDIDNTLVPYCEQTAGKKLTAHLKAFEDSGIKISLVSNNNLERVKIFNEGFGYYALHKAGKPSSRCVRSCIEHMNLKKDEVLMIGDQIFTDCISAHRAGIKCIILQPIQINENLFFKLKRSLEKPFIRIYKKHNG